MKTSSISSTPDTPTPRSEARSTRKASEELPIADDADLRIGVLDSSANELSIDAFSPLQPGDLLVLSKADLKAGAAAQPARNIAEQRGLKAFSVAAAKGLGLADLETAIIDKVISTLGREGAPALTRARHRRLVTAARDAVRKARDEGEAELATEDLRIAARTLGRITGRVDVEQILGAIFAEFCIGK